MKRPFNLLPLKPPKEHDPSENDPTYFYDNFASAFIEDMIKMTSVGLHIDKYAVEKLRGTIDTVLKDVSKRLNRNPLIKQYQEVRAKELQKAHREKATACIRKLEDFLCAYRPKDILHRTYAVNAYLKSIEQEHRVKDKWTVKDVKELYVWVPGPFLRCMLEGIDLSQHPSVKQAMVDLANYKLDLWNRPRYENANQAVTVPEFNPGSATQKRELFDMLKIEPLSISKKTGNASYGRDQLEELQSMTTDPELLKILQALIDYSFGGIIKSNFLAAFDSYTIDGVLHGNIKLFGAKSFRPTSNSPNLLNMPSTGSIYAKPLKQCFVAPKGMLIIQADYKSLEDVILANLTGDEGKLDIQRDKTLDAHCYNALGYYPEEVGRIISTEGSYKDQVRRFKQGVDEGNKELKEIRQKSKPNTFKLAYLGFPDDHKGGDITQEIYDNYHNKLYPGVKAYLDDYVIPTTAKQGYLHLGFGCRIYCDDIDESFRTMFNANFQFFSILTLIAVNEMNHRIRETGLEESIQIISTIYDSIYANISPDPEVIKWYSDNLTEIGSKDFMYDQIIPNTLTCSIGRNWAEEIPLPVGASAEDIEILIKDILEK